MLNTSLDQIGSADPVPEAIGFLIIYICLLFLCMHFVSTEVVLLGVISCVIVYCNHCCWPILFFYLAKGVDFDILRFRLLAMLNLTNSILLINKIIQAIH